MKKELIIAVLFLSVLLILPLIQALAQNQIQEQTYPGFDRFIDNIKLFFSSGDDKVELALNIREKEIDSAIINVHNNVDDKAIQNLERARDKLQIVQKQVSIDMAEEVKTNVDGVLDKIYEEKSLPENFKEYILEEEKTQLVANLVIEVDGKEGQILTREIVKNESSGQKQVVVVVNGVEGQVTIQTAQEMQVKINKISNEISTLVVEHTYAPGTSAGGESGVVIVGGVEVKTSANGAGLNEPVNNNPDLTIVHYDPSKDEVITHNIDETPGGIDSTYAEGTTATEISGTGIGGTNNVASVTDSS